MNCPICNIALQMTERQGIEIDYCPQCRGVWLDRGELDKIIERSLSQDAPMRSQVDSREERYEAEKHGQHGYNKHRKKSFIEELFD